MDPAFWQARWQQQRIGFHQDRPTPQLEAHWDAVGAAPGSRVFVPLAGKSRDMLWLAARGHRVLGVEVSALAVAAFFAEHGLDPQREPSPYGVHYRAGDIELICGDAFALEARALADCTAVFDRAALIALPPPLRERYVDALYACLPAGCRGLLVTLVFDGSRKPGPPFPVPDDEVRARFGPRWDIDLLERQDTLAAQPDFIDAGVPALDTCAYRLVHRG